MQVAKKALTKEPKFLMRSLNSVKHYLQSIQQLTDPPLDLNTIVPKSIILRTTPANYAQMAQWLRTNLQLSEEDLRHYLSKSPGILERSPVGRFITSCAQIRALLIYESSNCPPRGALFAN